VNNAPISTLPQEVERQALKLMAEIEKVEALMRTNTRLKWWMVVVTSAAVLCAIGNVAMMIRFWLR
jgi:hypothetical protein